MGGRRHGTLILGVGNDILMDDGIGPVITRQLESEFTGAPVDFETINLGGLEIFEFIKEYSNVIIIDAIKSGATPGKVFFMTLSDFRETCHLSSFHDISFLDAIRLGERIDIEMPETGVIAIEIEEDMIFGSSFSPIISRKYDSIYRQVRDYLLPVLEQGNLMTRQPERELQI